MFRSLRSQSHLRPVPVLLAAMMLCLLLFLAACGSAPTNTGSTTASSSPTASSQSSTDDPYGGGYGKNYGGGNTTPTPTKAITGPSKEVTINGSLGSFAFSPDSLTIPVGTTVVWTNSTNTPHTVTSNDGKTFNSGDSSPIDSGGKFSFTFTQPGTYKYHCDFHPSMVATIIVK